MPSRRTLALHARLVRKEIGRREGSGTCTVGRYARWGGVVLLLVHCLFAGYLLDLLARNAAPDDGTVYLIDRSLPAFMVAVFLARFFLEKGPTVFVRPFLVLPVQRRTVVALLFFRLLTAPLALATVLVAVPVWWRSVLPAAGIPGAVCWLGGFIALHVLVGVAGQLLRGLLMDVKRGVLFVLGLGTFVCFGGCPGAGTVLAEGLGRMFDALLACDVAAIGVVAFIGILGVAVFGRYVTHSLCVDNH
jgi:hypothetical protein